MRERHQNLGPESGFRRFQRKTKDRVFLVLSIAIAVLALPPIFTGLNRIMQWIAKVV